MTTRASEKMIEALALVMEGYSELQRFVENEYGSDDDADDPDVTMTEEMDTALVTEVRSVLENVMETEDYSTEEIAALLSTMTDAIEEIDPDVFEEGEEEEEETEEVEDYDDDDDYETESLDDLEDDDEYYEDDEYE